MKEASLYETAAERISGLIREGTYRPGDRVPSIRDLAGQMKVSMTTAIEAYRLLEDRGLIEARPQSGYYVRPSYDQHLPEPEVSTRTSPTRATVEELARMVVQDSRNPDLLPLGAALPNPDLLPVAIPALSKNISKL